jgi:hypothetical protein
MVESFKQTSSLIIVRLLLLLYVAKGSSSLDLREKQTIENRIFKPCKGKPNSHAWNIQQLFQSNRLPCIPTRESVPPQATVGPYAHPMCRTYACSVTTWSYSYPLCGMYSRTSVRVRKTKLQVVKGMSTPWADRLLGLPFTHNSRHVASTFKCLTTATTHCDLIKLFINTDGVSSKVMNHNHNPVNYPYSDCGNVNIATSIKLASDRQSLDFYRSC